MPSFFAQAASSTDCSHAPFENALPFPACYKLPLSRDGILTGQLNARAKRHMENVRIYHGWTMVEVVQEKSLASLMACILHGINTRRSAILSVFFLLFTLASAFAQGGPPYFTNDPGTPGNLNWEINLDYIPFLYSDQSVAHTPDVDINFGIGDRIQLTYESAWLRVQSPSSPVKYGMGQSNPGVKWRFYDKGESGLNISVFPQLFLNNPNDAVRRGITAASESFLLPIEFSRKIGPVDVNYEMGYQFTHKGRDGGFLGLVVGRDVTRKLELDMEFYYQHTFHPSVNQPTIDFGARYKLHSPVILLLMAGRSLEASRSDQSYFVGYFGIQFLLPPKSYKEDRPESTEGN